MEAIIGQLTGPAANVLLKLLQVSDSAIGRATSLLAIPGAVGEANTQGYAAIAEAYQPLSNEFRDTKPAINFVVMKEVKSSAGNVLLDSSKIGVFWESSNNISPIVIVPSYFYNSLSQLVNSVR